MWAEGDACPHAHDESRGARATGSDRPRGGGCACLFEAPPGPRCVTGVWAVVPVKELAGAKQRLSSCLSPEERRALATIMLEDVLDAVSAVRELAGVLVVTVDPVATSLADRYGARIVTEAAREGHTGTVAAAAPACPRGPGRDDDNARRHPAIVVSRDCYDACGAPGRACLHHRAGA